MASAGSTKAEKREEMERCHRLTPGVQVRKEQSGLLFYQRRGPRLYFLPSEHWLRPDYFVSGLSLEEWFMEEDNAFPPKGVLEALKKALQRLAVGGIVAHTSGSPRA